MAIDISVLIPVYQSERSLREIFDRLTMVLNRINPDYEIIMIDDGSTDHSFEVMQSLHKEDTRLKIIQLAKNYGQHHATFCAFQYCRGAFIITLDDDLQHPPEEIPKLIEKIKEGYDVVMGVPDKRQDTLYKNWGSLLIHKSLNIIYHKSPKIRMSSFRILRREIVSQIIAQPRSNVYIGALILDQHPRLANVEINHAPRKYGRSNYDMGKSINLAWQLLGGYSDIPMQLAKRLWQAGLAAGIVLLSLMIAYNVELLLFLLALTICILNLMAFQILKLYVKVLEKETERAQPAYLIKQMEG